MRRGTLWAITTAAVCLAVAGCSTTQSSEIRTGGMEADIRVTLAAGSTGAEVAVTLRVGSLTFVELQDPDVLTARSGDRSVELTKQRTMGHTSYHGRLDGVSKTGSQVVVDLQRGGDDESAPKSWVRLPGQVAISGPDAGAQFSRSRDDIRFELDRELVSSSGTLSWSGGCVQDGTIAVPPGTTTVTVAQDTIRAAAPPPSGTPQSQRPPKTCTARFTVTTRVEGTLDPAYGEGTIVAEATATRDLTLAP